LAGTISARHWHPETKSNVTVGRSLFRSIRFDSSLLPKIRLAYFSDPADIIFGGPPNRTAHRDAHVPRAKTRRFYHTDIHGRRGLAPRDCPDRNQISGHQSEMGPRHRTTSQPTCPGSRATNNGKKDSNSSSSVVFRVEWMPISTRPVELKPGQAFTLL